MHNETPVRRWLRRITASTTTAGLLVLAVPTAAPRHDDDIDRLRPTTAANEGAAPAVQLVAHRKPHPNRKIKRYRVRPGDTPSGIAVRYHAWTAQLLRLNHTRTLYAGEVILVPVVTRAARECTKHRHHRTNIGKHKYKPHKPAAKAGAGKDASRPKATKKRSTKGPAQKKARAPHHFRHARGWYHREATRAEVRRVIVTKAQRFGVNPDLALAVAWQESGWQHDRVSSAGAIGAMQIMPGTEQWMSRMVGRRLNTKDLHDNVTAGVALLRWLRGEARPRYAVAGYYQGLAGVRRYGMYSSTQRYVANVMFLKRRIARGWNPA